MPLLHRVARQNEVPICFSLNGKPCEGRRGDTLLSAILTIDERLRPSDFSHEPRAGFCQMSACQDCWVTLTSGERVRACSTPLAEGMQVITRAANGAGEPA
ncbi:MULTISPECIES: (2Fe-2S)-binding protein [Rhizobium]|uniref:(2Fe-2S)-binding protein n=1 Tax=Rhizobium TaxID=379 RepID=UPI0028A6B66E